MSDVKNKHVNIYIDQTAAEASLDKLQTKADGFNKKIDDCRKKQAALNDEIKKAADAGNSTTKLESQYKSLEKEVASTTSKLNDTTASMKKVQDQIDKGLRPSFAQQEKLVTSLRNQLKQLSEDAPEYAAKFKSFQSASGELDRMRVAMNGVEKAQSSWLQEAKVVAFGVLIGNTVQQAIGAIGNYLSGIVSGNAKLSDSLADLRRVTGLTADEVKNVYTELKKIDTRTSTDGLLNIAIIAGKLGVAKDDIVSFTEAVDKLQVALGDELGDADQITTGLGKILNVFDGKVDGDNITKLGNAIVDLANKGVASGSFLVDFSQRIAGVAKTANLALSDVLGLGAGLEESGQKVESSATAIQQLITKIATDLPGAARTAGKPLAEFQELFADKPQEALLQYAAGLQKNKASFAEVAESFKDAGEDGARSVAVLATLGQKTDFFRQKMKDAGDAIQQTGEIQDAFNLKNEDAAAKLDKLNKSLYGLITSKSLSDFFGSAVDSIIKFIDALKAAPGWIKENQTGFYLIITGIALMNASYIKAGVLIVRDTALKLINATTTKATAIATEIATAAQTAYIIVTNLLSGKISIATAAVRLFNTAMSLGAGPIGLIVVAVGALVVGIGTLINNTNKLTAAQRLNVELQERISSSTIEEIERVKELTAVLKDNTTSQSAKKLALQELIKINPEYLNGLTLENIKTAEGTKLINDYIKGLQAKAIIEAKQSLLTDKLKEQAEAYAKLRQTKEFKNASDEDLAKAASNQESLVDNHNVIYEFKVNDVKLSDVAKTNDEIKLLQKDLTDFTKNQIEETVTAQRKAGDDNVTSSAETIAKLEKQLQDLQAARKNIALTDTKALADNKKQIIDVQNELAKYEISTANARNKSSDEARKKFKEFLTGLSADANKSEVPEAMEKIYTAAKKYFDDLKTLNDGRLKGFINAEDYKKQIELIERTYHNTIAALQKEDPVKINVVPQVQQEDFDKVLKDAQEFLRKLTADNKAGLELDILNARNPKEHREAVIAELEFEKDQELSNTQLTANERALIEQQYRQKENQAWIDYHNEIIGQIQEVLSYASSVVDVAQQFNKAKENRENAALNADLARNDKTKAAYQKMLNGKLITQREYDLKVSALDAAGDKKKQELEKAQFDRNKKLQIAQALMNGAMGVTAVLAARPGAADILSLGVFRAINIGITLATVAAEIANIASQKPQFGKGGLLNGPSHSNGGMPIIDPNTGEKVMEVEGGEPILSKQTYRNNKPVIDALLNASMYHGGATIEPAYFRKDFRPVSAKSIVQAYQTLKFASGGILPGGSSVSGATTQTDPALLDTLNANQEMLAVLASSVDQLQQRLSKPIEADVSLKKLKDADDQQSRILADATFG